MYPGVSLFPIRINGSEEQYIGPIRILPDSSYIGLLLCQIGPAFTLDQRNPYHSILLLWSEIIPL